jgi:hypothetical protein
MKNITLSRDTVEQWLEDLEFSDSDKNVIKAIKQALAAPTVQAPVGYTDGDGRAWAVKWSGALPPNLTLFADPPAAPVPLTENLFVRELREYAQRFHSAHLFPGWDVQRALKHLYGYTTPPAAPIPDAITDNSESPEYRTGWNECRELTIQMRKS